MSPFEAISEALKTGDLLSHEDAESFEIGGVFIKVMELKKGDQVVSHAHRYNHAHILGKGRIILEVDGQARVVEAPSVIEIQAGKHHGMTALDDTTGFCVHNVAEIEAEEFRG